MATPATLTRQARTLLDQVERQGGQAGRVRALLVRAERTGQMGDAQAALQAVQQLAGVRAQAAERESAVYKITSRRLSTDGMWTLRAFGPTGVVSPKQGVYAPDGVILDVQEVKTVGKEDQITVSKAAADMPHSDVSSWQYLDTRQPVPTNLGTVATAISDFAKGSGSEIGAGLKVAAGVVVAFVLYKVLK